MQRKMLPGQRDGESLDDYVERSWVTEPGLQDEFGGDRESYAAFCKADALNLVWILRKTKG